MDLDLTRIACFFATSGHSGVDRAAQYLLPTLARRGYQVDLLKIKNHGPDLFKLSLLPENNKLNIIELSARHTFTALPALIFYLHRNRPYILLTDKDRVNRTAWFAKKLAKIPTNLIFSSGTTISHDLAHRGSIERWVQRTSMKKIYPLAKQIIVTSQGVAEDLALYTGLNRKLIKVVPSPVIPAWLFTANLPQPNHPWFNQSNIPLILGAGELCSRKDFDTLIRAFALVRRERPAHLMILGHGRARERLLKLAVELKISSDLALPGYVSDLYNYFAHADLFVFSSRWEGLGFVLIEALAVGTPVVATDCPSGPREILHNGRYGSLVPVGDEVALAAAINKTLDHPLPKNFLQEAARPYEIEASTDAYLAAMGLTLKI